MTKLLEKALGAVRALPDQTQDDFARLLLQLTGEEQAAVMLTAEEQASFDESLAQIARGEFASDEQVASVWAKHGV